MDIWFNFLFIKRLKVLLKLLLPLYWELLSALPVCLCMVDAGTNCSYMEEAYQIAGMKEDEGRVCLNTEWGSFGNAGELDDLLSEYDLLTDKTSFNQGKCR